jgi:hypothetical protein
MAARVIRADLRYHVHLEHWNLADHSTACDFVCGIGGPERYANRVSQTWRHMMKQIRADALREVEQALARYEEEVNVSRLAPSTKRTYIQHATSFVAWLKGEFEPGSHT